MITSDFIQFLNALSIDPTLEDAFNEDADAVLATTRLSTEEKELLKSGDAEKINLALSSSGEVWGARAVIESWAARAVIKTISC